MEEELGEAYCWLGEPRNQLQPDKAQYRVSGDKVDNRKADNQIPPGQRHKFFERKSQARGPGGIIGNADYLYESLRQGRCRVGQEI